MLCYIHIFYVVCLFMHHIYSLIFHVYSFIILVCVNYLLYNAFIMCVLSYLIMCMILSMTNTHFKRESMLCCLPYPTLNKVFLLLLLQV